MVLTTPHLFFGKVMHGRLFPKRNHFQYGIYYLTFPLSKRHELPIRYNTSGLLSFYDRDHGDCDGSDLEDWARQILSDYGLNDQIEDITLICMPRVIGYVFNPVSFWLCHDREGKLRAVLCEVHNTFGERHTYICAHTNNSEITSEDILRGQKVFHVSPLLKREGHYTFRFDTNDDMFAVWIDFFDDEGKKQLVTSLIGKYEPMCKDTLKKAFWGYPLVTLKAIFLIHWQALKLLLKGIKYIRRPKQIDDHITGTDGVTKNNINNL